MDITHEQALRRGVFALKKLQRSDGSFSDTVFYTGLILDSLSTITAPNIKDIITKGKTFLETQRSSQSTFNYVKKPDESIYPDDLDDTSICLAALAHIDKTSISEEILISFITTLIQTEEVPGGPYNTWILNDYKNTPWHDIDIGVNSNIAYFLKTQHINLDGLVTFIEERIKNNDFTSKYYHKKISIIYFLSKWYLGAYSKKLLTIIEDEIFNNLSSNSVQDIALGVCSWIRLGGSVSKIEHIIDYIILKQCLDGSWQPSSFFIEKIQHDTVFYSGSRTFTTACVLEALNLYQKAEMDHLHHKKQTDHDCLVMDIKQSIITQNNHLPDTIQQQLISTITAVTKNDPLHETTLLPYFFYTSLTAPSLFSEKDILMLCKAHLYGWVAYTIYDSIMDGEPTTDLLPLANICMRELVAYYEIFDSSDLVRETLEKIEHANLLEQETCKFEIVDSKFIIPENIPHYKNIESIAYKSIGHALSLLVIHPSQDLESFFAHYLTARQLSDDAHDWLDDLQNGYINPAGSLVLQKYRYLYPHQDIINLQKNSHDIDILKTIFNDFTLDAISKEILYQLSCARVFLEKLSDHVSPEYLLSLLDPLEKTVRTIISNKKIERSILDLF